MTDEKRKQLWMILLGSRDHHASSKSLKQSARDIMLDRLNACKETVGRLIMMLHQCCHCVL